MVHGIDHVGGCSRIHWRGKREFCALGYMAASVNILTGDKTVPQYLIKPIPKTAERALRER
jgi:hypothetical protein